MLRKVTCGLVGMMALVMVLTVLPALGYVEAGNQLGDLEFQAPLNPEAAKYLGVPADKPFKLSQLGTPYVLVEVFATGCSHCVHHAPIMNQLYGLISKNPKTAGKIKVIGLGSTDSAANLMAWQKQFKVPFALVPDPQSKTTEKINIMGTPTTIFMDKSGKVLLAKPGAFQNPDDFLKELIGLMK